MDPLRTDRLLAIAALVLLIVGCLTVLQPFLMAILWAAILVATTWPVLRLLDRATGDRRTLSALLMTLAATLVLLAPFLILSLGIADNARELAAATRTLLKQGLPDLPQWVRSVPFVGDRFYFYWQGIAHNQTHLLAELQRLFAPAKDWLLSGGAAFGLGIMQITLSLFVSFFFYRDGEEIACHLRRMVQRLAGERGWGLLQLAEGTVTGVVYGILGTALAQGVLAGIGFAVAGVPGALVLGLATFFLSVVPVGPPLIWGPAAFWLWQNDSHGWAIFLVLWGVLVVSMVDNVLKPMIVSRGASLPFALVFLGMFGGVAAFGVIGAFLGPTLLAVGYRLLVEWGSSLPPVPPEQPPSL